MRGRHMDGAMADSMSVTSGQSRWEKETASILAEDRHTAEAAARSRGPQFYDMSGHDIYPGICAAIGLCDDRPVAQPSAAQPMRAELDIDRDLSQEQTHPTMWGCRGSGLRIAAALAWMLRDHGELTVPADAGEGEPVTYIAPLAPVLLPPELAATAAATREEAGMGTEDAAAQRAAASARRRGLTLLPVRAEVPLDETLHSTEAGRTAYSDVRLVSPAELRQQQVAAGREFFFEAVSFREDVQASLRRAQYVLLPGSSLGIGAAEGDTSYGAPGGVNALCLLLEECSMGNRAVCLSLVGCSFNHHMAADVRCILQYVDFLFLTELECRRLLVILDMQPNLSLEQSALWLAAFAKHAGVRPRVVVVVPNPSLGADFEKDPLWEDAEREKRESTQGRRKASFAADGSEVFAKYKEYDTVCHYNPDELRGRVLVASLGEFWYTPGWPAAAAADAAPGGATAGRDTFPGDPGFDTLRQQRQQHHHHHQQQQPQSTASARRQLQTYYHNAKLDFRLSLDATDASVGPMPFGAETGRLFSDQFAGDDDEDHHGEKGGEGKDFVGLSLGAGGGSKSSWGTGGEAGGGDPDPRYAEPLPIDAASHLAFADNFIGGFLAMVIRAELQINQQHRELDSQNTSTSFIQGTVPNEKVTELARQRSERLQRERERQWPGGHKPPPTATPKTATPRLAPRNRAKLADGPVPDRQSLFQSPESRQRNSITTAGQPAMQTEIEGWGGHDNVENMEYGSGSLGTASLIKWAGAGPLGQSNIVSGRRILHECLQAGLYALYDGSYDWGAEEAYAGADSYSKCRFFELFSDL